MAELVTLSSPQRRTASRRGNGYLPFGRIGPNTSPARPYLQQVDLANSSRKEILCVL
jgi:hypothetical protein